VWLQGSRKRQWLLPDPDCTAGTRAGRRLKNSDRVWCKLAAPPPRGHEHAHICCSPPHTCLRRPALHIPPLALPAPYPLPSLIATTGVCLSRRRRCRGQSQHNEVLTLIPCPASSPPQECA